MTCRTSPTSTDTTGRLQAIASLITFGDPPSRMSGSSHCRHSCRGGPLPAAFRTAGSSRTSMPLFRRSRTAASRHGITFTAARWHWTGKERGKAAAASLSFLRAVPDGTGLNFLKIHPVGYDMDLFPGRKHPGHLLAFNDGRVQDQRKKPSGGCEYLALRRAFCLFRPDFRVYPPRRRKP